MNGTLRLVFGACFAASLILIAAALHLWGAAEIRADPSEVFGLTFAAAVWLVLATMLFSWLGLSYHDDIVERKNGAALVALCGALIAFALIYIGGSIGEGPSYSNNVFSAGLGTAGLLALWVVLELCGNVSRSITEERDLASGLRLAGFLLATGLLLGRAVAGDWHSEGATLHDFIHDGWPGTVLCGMALLIEWFARPSRCRPFPSWPRFGLLPAILYLATAGAWLLRLGAWEGMPQ
jgi:uncharacterized membrane protein YjfL (UPF0719 family)